MDQRVSRGSVPLAAARLQAALPELRRRKHVLINKFMKLATGSKFHHVTLPRRAGRVHHLQHLRGQLAAQELAELGWKAG